MALIDDIVNACVEHYKTISKKVKLKDNEWTVISAIVKVTNDKDISVISMGTGSKCIGKSFLSPKGDVLNDSHAEIIARRAFLKYLYHQIILFNNSSISEILSYDDFTFHIKSSVKFYFVTSMSPCGDASIMPKLTLHSSHDIIGTQTDLENVAGSALKRKSLITNFMLKSKLMKIDEEDEPIDIHRTGAKCLPDSEIQDSHLPGVHYHSTSAVRIKPGRGDPTLSLSCSDKIAKWNAVGWQGALLSVFFKTPIFMENIICGGGCPFSKESFDRAVNERIERQLFVPIYQSRIPFPDIKEENKKCSSLSIIWSNTPEKTLEVSVNGRKQGITKRNINKKVARTSICKKELLLLFIEAINSHRNKEMILKRLNIFESEVPLTKMKYRELKILAEEYQRHWNAVKKNYFKVWSNKPVNLLLFTAEND